jgi:DNA-binding CsgD family transcriptional regulator
MTIIGQFREPAANRKRRAAAAHATTIAVKERVDRRINESPRSAELAATLPRRRLEPVNAPWSVRLKQARTIAESFGAIGLAAAVLSVAGEVITSNKLFAALVPGTVRELSGRPRLTDPTADRLINDALARVPSMPAGIARSVPVRAQGGKPATMVHLFPVAADAYDGFAGVGAILTVSTAQSRPAPSLEILRGLYNLSPAEARVAQGIATGSTVETIADRSGVSRETIRSQLKTVLAKTGTKRQLNLAVLLLGLRQVKL